MGNRSILLLSGAFVVSSGAVGPVGEPTSTPITLIAEAAPLEVHILDVGQGDAIVIRSGRSTVVVDGGPSTVRMRQHIQELSLAGDTLTAGNRVHIRSALMRNVLNSRGSMTSVREPSAEKRCQSGPSPALPVATSNHLSQSIHRSCTVGPNTQGRR